MSLLKSNQIFKPFKYPWAYKAWKKQQQLHWLPEEVSLSEDVQDWKKKLTYEEKHLLTQIFRFFTQADIEVNNCYMKNYSSIFQPIEVQMMLSAFSNIETIHIDAYSYLLDTIGMPEIEYQAFHKYKEMKDKYEYMKKHNVNDKVNIGITLAMFGAFTEGLQLFASFAMLLNFQRFGKMKGMGQIVSWSLRDETLHTISIIKLFRVFIKENSEIWNKDFRNKIYHSCEQVVKHEDAFIELAFCFKGAIQGMCPDDIKSYIRYIANVRLKQLGLKKIYKIVNNPIPWINDMIYLPEHTNFFENRVTEYSKSATDGSWDNTFQELVK